jgi:hypothetical protein
MSLIHLENKVNEFTGYGFLNAKLILDHFPINSEKKQHILMHLKPTKNWMFQNIMNQCSSYFNFHFKLLKRNLGYYKTIKSFKI